MSANPHKIALLVCTLFLATCAVGRSAAERVFSNFNIAVTPPDTWEDITAQRKQPGLIVAYRDPANTRMVMIAQIDIPGPVPVIDDQFIGGFEKGAEKSGGGKRLTGRVMTVQGIEAYERTSLISVPGRSMYTIGRAIPILGHSVNLMGIRSGGGMAADDPEIQHFLASFRFLTVPPHTNSAAYTSGYRIGAFVRRAWLPILVVIGGFGLILMVIIIVVVSRSGKSSP